jgi:hypothetical protein
MPSRSLSIHAKERRERSGYFLSAGFSNLSTTCKNASDEQFIHINVLNEAA